MNTIPLRLAIEKANTGADAIKRAPIVIEDTGFRCLRIQDVSNGKDFKNWGFCTVSETDYPRFKLKAGDILIARTGNTIGVVRYINEDLPAVFNNGLIRLKINRNKFIPKFIYYCLSNYNYKSFIESISAGTSTQPNMKIDALLDFEIPDKSLIEQRSIVAILSAFDDKIELLREENKTLEATAKTIFKEWFVDFNFPFNFETGQPDLNGKPYKKSGGKMVESEFGEVPEGWRVGVVSEIVDIFDYKRKPLSSMVRQKIPGNYPYYGATGVMDHINDFLFNGVYLLLAEDGSVVDESGLPIIQYVSGAFWVSNHAHILQGKNNVSTEYLYWLFKQMPISDIITGAVQLKISQTNLLSKKIIIPAISTLLKFQPFLAKVLIKTEFNKSLVEELAQIRDVQISHFFELYI